MTDDEVRLLNNPIYFVETKLGLPLYPWQDKALAPLMLASGKKAKRVNIAVKAPNGAGKDERVIAGASYYWLTKHKNGKVVITSKSDLQLSQQTIPQLERHKNKFGYSSVQTPRYTLTTPDGGKLVAFVTNDPNRIEGWHKDDDIDGPLLLIVNEAKGIDDDMLTTLLARCTVNAVILISSPGMKMGQFYKCFGEYKSSWRTVSAGLVDCPHIPQDRIDYVLNTFGKDHPITRSTLYGEFMDQDEIEKFIVSFSALEFALQNPPKHIPGPKFAFCDFADGGAENVIAFRNGNKLELIACWREANKLASVSRFISEFRKLKLEAHQVWGDAADKEMCDLLEEAGWKIRRQNFGSPPNDPNVYLSWGAEAWREFSIGVEKREWIVPNDDKLTEQLTTRMRAFGRAGKLGVEEKYAMRKRNLPSPDRADAIVGVAAIRDYSHLMEERFNKHAFTGLVDVFETLDRQEKLAEIGADAGDG